MIYIHPDYAKLFCQFRTIDDFLKIKVDLVRDFKNRKTGRFEIKGHGFYIKKHFECGFGAILDELSHLRKPHIGAGHEKAILDKLHSIGIETMKIAVFGQEGNSLASQRSFLITEELTNVKSLEEICSKWSSTSPAAMFKKSLITQVALISKELHCNGLNHRDYYLCHFLLDISGQPEDYEQRHPKLFLIDLHRAQQRSRIPFRWRVKDIGGLYFSAMDIGLTQRDLLRFIRTYTGKSLRQTLLEDRRFWDAVKSRASKTYTREHRNDKFNVQSVQCGNNKASLLSEFCKGSKALEFMEQLENLTETGVVLKKDISTQVVRCKYNNWDIVIKRYNHLGIWHSLRHTIKGSRAKKCWRFGQTMTGLNIPCAAPVGVIEQRKFGLIWQSYIINEFVEGPNIRNYLNQSSLTQQKKYAMLVKIQDLVKQLVKNKMIHNDLKHCNLLIHNDSPVLIDLDSMQRYRNPWLLSLYKWKMDNKIRKRIYAAFEPAVKS